MPPVRAQVGTRAPTSAPEELRVPSRPQQAAPAARPPVGRADSRPPVAHVGHAPTPSVAAPAASTWNGRRVQADGREIPGAGRRNWARNFFTPVFTFFAPSQRPIYVGEPPGSIRVVTDDSPSKFLTAVTIIVAIAFAIVIVAAIV